MYNFKCYTVETLWKAYVCLTKVAKFGPFSCTILYKSCLSNPSWQATSSEKPPSWVTFVEGFHCIVTGTSEHVFRLTPICIRNLTLIGSDNDLSPDQHQAIIKTNAGILSTGPLGINFSEISMEIQTFSFQENVLEIVVCKRVAILSRPQYVKRLKYSTLLWLVV